jgi:2-methylisocitrate lyase-like PEP mutase family enzyme
MAKLQDLFTQARRTQSGGGMGFLGKNRQETKARAAALVVTFPQVAAGRAEAALKAGADGLLFSWDGKDRTTLQTIKQEIETALASKENLIAGLEITGGWEDLDREGLVDLKDQGLQYIILPFNAPARLLALESKGIEKVVVVPMRQGETYPLYIRSLSAFDNISAVLLAFGLPDAVGAMTIEEVLDYRAVREAIRFPAFIEVKGDIKEEDAYTLQALGVQAVVLTASEDEETTRTQVKNLRELLEKVHQDESDRDAPSVPAPGRK